MFYFTIGNMDLLSTSISITVQVHQIPRNHRNKATFIIFNQKKSSQSKINYCVRTVIKLHL